MIKRLPFICLILLGITFFASPIFAQYKIQGAVVDTATEQNMGLSSVSIMSTKDSILQDFTRVDENGRFELNVKEQGDYFIRYAYPGFTPYVSDVKVSNELTVIDTAFMMTYENLLQEVVVRESRPITIKGDTIEYTADSFKVRDFATVDELLKKLPGIEIDQNGKIKAQGQNVTKMLVDGEEFFSDDPAVVAKMLRASDIDKVQVFDNKSEEAKVTGIDDADKTKAINLTLKESAKQGLLGKALAGAGPPEYYEGQAMLNYYKEKQKAAAFLIGSNTNNQGMGWEDANNFAGDRGGETSFDDGVMTTTYSNDDYNGVGWDGNFQGQGVPQSLSGGASYNNKFGKDDKLGVGVNYGYNNYQRTTITDNKSQYFMPDTQYVNLSHRDGHNQSINNSLSTRINYKIDSLTNLTVRLSGSKSVTESSNISNSRYVNTNGLKINESNTNNQKTGESYKTNADVTLSKKFKKEGRSFTANVKGNYAQSNGATNFLSVNDFYQSGAVTNFNQRKNDSSNNSSANARLTFSEPIIKEKLFVTLNASTNYNSNSTQLITYDKDPISQLDTFNALFSSDVENIIQSNRVGATFRYNTKAFKATLGGDVSFTNYESKNLMRDTSFKQDYLNFFPNASISYRHKRSASISLSYRGSTRQPSINQVQVMVQNSDPLNISLGNPTLTQEFTHDFSLNFNQYQMLSEQYSYGYISFNKIQNAFGQSRTINGDGVSTYQTINIDGNWNMYGYLSYSFKIKPIKTNIGFSINPNFSNSNSILNSVINSSKNMNLRFGLEVRRYQDTGLTFEYEINPSYNVNKTSVYSSSNNKYWMVSQNLNLNYKFPKNIELGSTINWLLREKISENDQFNNVFIMNAYAQYTFLKNRSLALRLEGKDLFNQNIGFERHNYSNVVSETNYNTIKRYFMLKLIWNFKYNMGAKEEKKTTSFKL